MAAHRTRRDAIVSDIYQTIADQSLWPKVLGSLASSMNAKYSALFSRFESDLSPSSEFRIAHGIDQAVAEEWVAHWAPIHLRRLNGMKFGLFGPLYRDEALMTYDEYHHSEHYRGFEVPNGIEHTLGGGHFLQWNQKQHVFEMAFQRGPEQGEFEPEETRIANAYWEHIQQALKLHAGLQEQLHAATARTLVMAIEDAAFIVDRDFKIVAANVSAEAMLRNGSVLRTSKCILVRTASNRRLLEMLCKMFQSKGYPCPCTAETFDGRGILYLFNVMPIDLNWPEAYSNAHALVIVRSAQAGRKVFLQQMRRLYELTGAETRVLLHLIEGRSPEQICDALAIRRETFRTHVRHLLSKTNCHNQGQLVQLALRTFGASPLKIGDEA
jgi:DNA-binding CsgD family transcriptional regulator